MVPGQAVTWCRTAYTVVRPGCATGWEQCPHGEHAVTVIRDGKTLTECADRRVLS
jgi:hypothetical protein